MSSLSHTTYRIVLIEDSRPVAEVTRVVLEEQGNEVAVAHDGPTGLALAEQFRPDVVLCDLRLGGALSGDEVARRLRQLPLERMPLLVAVTAHTAEEVGNAPMEAGFDLMLTKPMDFDQFQELLQRRLARAS